MKRIFGFLTVAAFAGMVFAANAFAASSGNFSATTDNTQCTINSANGSFLTGTPSSTAGFVWEIGSNDIDVQIANGSGTTLIVTPSLVTGLFTDNKITSNTSTSTEDVGIQIQVNVTPAPGTNVLPAQIKIAPVTNGDTSNGTDTGATCTPNPGGNASCVIYDQRFIQISSTVLSQLSGCSALSGGTCFELIESTLSAHSFNFYVQAPGGNYIFDVDAQLFIGKNNTAPANSVVGCAGPGTVTVQQVKNFSFNSTITF